MKIFNYGTRNEYYNGNYNYDGYIKRKIHNFTMSIYKIYKTWHVETKEISNIKFRLFMLYTSTWNGLRMETNRFFFFGTKNYNEYVNYEEEYK